MDITQIIFGAGAGVTYALTSFAKKEGQQFNFLKFGTTIVIGAAAGAGQGLIGMPLEGAHTYLISLGATPIVENAIKFIWRKIWMPIKKKFA